MPSSPSRKLVVVPYFYPPFPGSGNRWPALARHLRMLGHRVTVVATNAFGTLDPDAERGVVRVGDLRSVGVLRRLLRRGDLPVGGSTAIDVPAGALLTKVLVPDMNVVTWLPAALIAVRRMLKEQQVDCLVTSSPPESTHLIGLLLGGSRPTWIADFRDGWRFEPLREPFPTAAQETLDAWLERRVAQEADMVVGATLPIVRDLEQRLGANVAHVSNGWDPLTEADPTQRAGATQSSGVVRLVYTGTLTLRGSPTPLFEAVRAANEGAARPLRLVHAGRLTTEERSLIDRTGVASFFEYLGTLDRPAAIALQRDADALVLLTSRNTSEATGKLFEYMASGRPIVALAEGNEAERIVRETNTGVTVSPDDVHAIVAAFRRVASGQLEREYAPRGLERYTYPGPAEAMAEVIEQAIVRRRR
jgi:glycosyltransferase involved in cell wall biosynthesis